MEPALPRGEGIHDMFCELRAVTRKPGGRAWTAMLLQIERETGHLHMEYEYDDPARWKVTPANIEVMREALRPK